MKKLIALSLAMLFLGAGIASATDFSLTGSYFVRGTYADNKDGTRQDTNSFGDYDHELSLDANWKIDDDTLVFARFEARDDNWADSSNPTEGSAGGDLANLDDNWIVEQVWGNHTFANGIEVQVGLMSANAWAGDFANEGGEAYRVRATMPTAFGSLIGILQKNSETGEVDEDNDTYILGLVSKVGGVGVKPLLVYTNNEAMDSDTIIFNLALDGTMGNVGWEAEAIYRDIEVDNGTDYDLHGIYGNIWTQLNALKVGALAAYGSYDEDAGQGFQFGDDFAAGGALLLGDDVFLLNGDTNANDIQAATLFAVYCSYAVNNKLTLGAYLGYADSNVDEATSIYDGADAWEVSVNGSYKITGNVTYSVAAGIAEVDLGDAAIIEPDEAIEINHKLSFSF